MREGWTWRPRKIKIQPSTDRLSGRSVPSGSARDKPMVECDCGRPPSVGESVASWSVIWLALLLAVIAVLFNELDDLVVLLEAAVSVAVAVRESRRARRHLRCRAR